MLERFKKEKLAIKFDSVEEQKEFLEIAEKEGFKWASGDKPTSFIPMNRFEGDYIITQCDEVLFYGSTIKPSNRITWKDYKADYEEVTFPYLKGDVHLVDNTPVLSWDNLDKKLVKEPLWFATFNCPHNIKAIYPNEKKRLVVVKWGDNTTTKVKCSKEDNFDIYVGVALAIAIKKYGTNTQFRKNVDKLVVKNKTQPNVVAK